MSTTFSQNFNSFNFIKWEILLLPWTHLKLRPKHKMTYNSLSPTPKSLRFWETHKIYVFYICSKFCILWPQGDIQDIYLMCLSKIWDIEDKILYLMTTRRYHFQKKLTSKLRLKFQMLGFLSIQIQMTWNFSHTYISIWSIRSQSYRSKKV